MGIAYKNIQFSYDNYWDSDHDVTSAHVLQRCRYAATFHKFKSWELGTSEKHDDEKQRSRKLVGRFAGKQVSR